VDLAPAPETEEACLTAAGTLARAVPLARADAGLAADRRDALAEEYGRAAVEHLRTALQDRGGRAESLRDTQFDSVRQRPDFQELARAAGMSDD
jgi:hypothetical protein